MKNYIILNLYDEYHPIIVSDELNRPIIFNSYQEAENYSILIERFQIVELNVNN